MEQPKQPIPQEIPPGKKENQEIPPPLQTPPHENPPQKEVGGAKGLDPTRYGDWEHNGRCTDF